MVAGRLAVVVVAAVGGGIAAAGIGDDDDTPLTGATLQRATDAALGHTGGGAVTETEIGDDGAAYDVEVKLNDGSKVEVQLDADFRVMATEEDDDGEDD